MQPRTSSSSGNNLSTTHEQFSDICKKLCGESEKCAIKFIPSWMYNSDVENFIDVMQCLNDMTLNNIVTEDCPDSIMS